MRRTERSTKKLNSFIMFSDIWIIHNIKNNFFLSLFIFSINSYILFCIFPCSFSVILIFIIFLRNWSQSSISPWWRYFIILLSYILPFLTLFLIHFLLFINKLRNCILIFIEMIKLIYSKMTMITSDLFRLECFHVIFYWKWGSDCFKEIYVFWYF